VLLGAADLRTGSFAAKMGRARRVRLSPKSGAIADIAALRVCATSRLLHRSETLLNHHMLGTKLRLVTVAVASWAFYSRCCQTITAFVSIRNTLSWLNSSWW
jgi:hypothetical protein